MKKTIKINNIPSQESNLNQVMDNFILDCQIRGLSQATLNNYSSTCKMFLEVIGNKSLESLSTHDVNRFIVYLRQRGNNNTSINTRLKSFKSFLNYADVTLSIPNLKTTSPIKVPYTDEEIKKLLKKPVVQSYTQYRNHAIVSTLIATGMRSRTLLGLKIKDVNFDNDTIFLNEVKNNKKYFIPLSSTLKQTLKYYLSLYTHDPDDYLFVNLYGEPLDRNALKQTIRDYNLKRGVTKTSIHLFRHTFAYNYIRNGGNVMYLQNILGHSKLETTKIYLAIQTDDLQKNFDDYCMLDQMQRKGIKLKNKK